MLTVEEALAMVVAGFSVLPAERVALPQTLGRILAEDLRSRVSSPPLAVSSMDGYALRSADATDSGGSLVLVGQSAAGSPFLGRVEPGQCVRIFTGAPLPEGADAVEMQEETVVEASRVTFVRPVEPGRFVRPRGMDFDEGDTLLVAGRLLSARDIGLIAAMNRPWIHVRRRPRVAVLATGDELFMPGDPVKPAGIPSSNSLAVCAYVQALGGEAIDLGIADDDAQSLKEKLLAARGADLLVTIGGASVGDFDLVASVLGDNGMKLGFHKLAMRPGKPLIFGHMGEMPVLGLPGNTVSAGVTALLFLRPALRVMLGLWRGPEPFETAVLGRDLPANDARRDHLRASLEIDAQGRRVATPFQGQDSALLAGFARADCLVVRPPHAPPARAGENVPIIRLRDGMAHF